MPAKPDEHNYGRQDSALVWRQDAVSRVVTEFIALAGNKLGAVAQTGGD